MTLIAILVAIVLAWWLLRAVGRLDAARRRRLGRVVLGAVGVAVVGLVLVRLGHWLALAGAAAIALLGRVGPPLIRALALLGSLRRQRGQRDAGAAAGERVPGPARRQAMTRAEALEVLGLAEGATADEVSNAYRELMKKVHPDTVGGSTYLAKKLNEAKDVLLS